MPGCDAFSLPKVYLPSAQQYMHKQLHPILFPLIKLCVRERPKNVARFMFLSLTNKLRDFDRLDQSKDLTSDREK